MIRRALVVLAAIALAACEAVAEIEAFAPAPEARDGGGAAGSGDGGAFVDGCPSGRGPAMVRVGPRCIDTTEVTEGQYAVFLGADAGAPPPECTWNTTYVPGKGPNEEPLYCTTGAGAPVRCVDWCDAFMFCKWAQKRLCAATNGGRGAYDAIGDPARSEWTAACEGAERRAFPYGNAFDARACNGFAQGSGSPSNAGQLKSCEGAPSRLYDMSGNVHEWEDACTAPDAGPGGAPNDRCRIRGGSMTDTDPALLRCDASNGAARSFMAANVGFRCCADARD